VLLQREGDTVNHELADILLGKAVDVLAATTDEETALYP
jgi:hypothetical protein